MVSAPTAWPCVAFFEDDNYVSQEDFDTSPTEQFAVLRYRIDVYSNKANGRRAEVKEILEVIRPILYARNFTRLSSTPLNDLGDKIYHKVETYRVKTDGDAFYRL